MQRIFTKKCFLFVLGSVCSIKLFHLGGKFFTDDEKVEMAETTVKRLLCTSKAMGQVYQCCWRVCGEINVSFPVRISRFTFYIHLRPIY
jgi:hypothetical protein